MRWLQTPILLCIDLSLYLLLQAFEKLSRTTFKILFCVHDCLQEYTCSTRVPGGWWSQKRALNSRLLPALWALGIMFGSRARVICALKACPSLTGSSYRTPSGQVTVLLLVKVFTYFLCPLPTNYLIYRLHPYIIHHVHIYMYITYTYLYIYNIYMIRTHI